MKGIRKYTQEEIRQEFVKYLMKIQRLDSYDAQIAATSLFTPASYNCFINYEYEGEEVIDGATYKKYSNTSDFSSFRTFSEEVDSFIYYEYKDENGVCFYSLDQA